MGAYIDHFAFGYRGLGIATAPEYVLREDEALYVDWGCVYRGCYSDTGTTLAMRPSSPELQRLRSNMKRSLAMRKLSKEHLERIHNEPPGDVEKILKAIETIKPRQYVCYRACGPITIDGRLDEPSWKKAAWTDLFVHIEDDYKIPFLATRAKMLWDDQYFYIAADLEDPDVWGVETRRDAPIPDPDFEVFIDPDGDALNYMEMEMNALNTVWDLFLEHPYHRWRPKQPDGWNPTAWNWKGIKTAVQVDGTLNAPWIVDKGWTVEIAFDWESMAPHCVGVSCPPKHGDRWRVNMSRVHRNREGTLTDCDWVWSRQGIYNMHVPEMYGYVQFSETVVGTGFDEFVERE